VGKKQEAVCGSMPIKHDVKNYAQSFSLLKKMIEAGRYPFYSAETLYYVLTEEFNRGVINAPKEIYGNWAEYQRTRNKISSLYLNQKTEYPTNIGPKRELVMSSWRHVAPFFRDHHAELLWFLEKERLILLGKEREFILSPTERKLKERATGALQRGNRTKGFALLEEALCRSPEDYTMLADMGFLMLNDKANPKLALNNFEKACRLIPQRNSDIYCFLALQVNLAQRLNGSLSRAYLTTQSLMRSFKTYGEVLYQHALNAIRIDKLDDGLSLLKILCEAEVNYALKAYEAFDSEEYRVGLRSMLRELADQKGLDYLVTMDDVKRAITEIETIEINELGEEIMPYIKEDLSIIKALGNNKSYVSFETAEFLIKKTPSLLLARAKKILAEQEQDKLRKNSYDRKRQQEDLNDRMSERKSYNMVGLLVVSISTPLFFILLLASRGFLFALSFCLVFALALLTAIAINSFKMNKIKLSSMKEDKHFKKNAYTIQQEYRTKLSDLTSKMRKVSDI